MATLTKEQKMASLSTSYLTKSVDDAREQCGLRFRARGRGDYQASGRNMP
jgi:hypothetical protein